MGLRGNGGLKGLGGPGGRPRMAALAAAAVLALTPALAACSDDDGYGSTTSPSPSVTRSSEQPAADAPADATAARAQIEKAWQTFFDPTASTDEKTAVLEDGERMRPVLMAFGSDPNAAKTSAKVTAVSFTSATAADVTYDLLVGGTPALPDSKGTAVFQDNTWKVSVKTLCGLVRISGNAAVPGC